MAANRRKNQNAVPVVAIGKCVLAVVFLGLVGLSHVSLKNRLHAGGRQLKECEKELAAVRVKNQSARARLAQITTRAALERRLAEVGLALVPIAPDRIVRLDAGAGGVIEAIRPAANEEGGR